MKHQVRFQLIFVAVVGLAIGSDVTCQTPSQPHAPNNPLPQWVHDNQRKRDEFERIGGTRAPDADLRRAEAAGRSTARLPRDKIGVMSEADRKRIKALRAPNPEDLETYKEFLGQPRTGIFRLFPNANCVSKGVIRVDGDCANYVPGADSYKFRPDARLPDIMFSDGKLVSFGFFTQYVIGAIGDVDITKIAKGDPMLGYVEQFLPGTTIPTAREQYRAHRVGVDVDGRRYSYSVKPELDASYALRIVAYRCGNNAQKRALGALRNGVYDISLLFNRLRHDTRIDMLIVFRVIRREDDGNISIIWKELDRKESPKITFAKDEKWEDFK